jgi:hypothetical protein
MNMIRLILLTSFLITGPAFAQDEAASSSPQPEAELQKEKGAFKETWVHPDADFTQYDKLYLWEGVFEFRDVGPAQRTRSSMMNTRKREFGINDADREKFEEIVGEAFVKGLQKGKRFELVSELGPRTMIMRGGVLDIISKVPPETAGRSEIYLASIGEGTLVLELLDAETGDVLALVAERRSFSRPGGIDFMTMPTNSATIIGDIRRWATSAGKKLSKELDKAISGK